MNTAKGTLSEAYYEHMQCASNIFTLLRQKYGGIPVIAEYHEVNERLLQYERAKLGGYLTDAVADNYLRAVADYLTALEG